MEDLNQRAESNRFHRAMTRPFFTKERISDFEIYDRNWDLSLKLAKARLAQGYSIDIQVCWPCIYSLVDNMC